ncbi:unnamed protein product [Polarella glacialis]|uniref:Rab-GAP TBC domain-containing protein n=1 Tax=Polarella glacialis TaxID=89957 RepID=A0A813GPU4_POLGL|nr:unnamed protein product [Polarella glacialis]
MADLMGAPALVAAAVRPRPVPVEADGARDFLRRTAEYTAACLPITLMEYCRPTLWLWLASSANPSLGGRRAGGASSSGRESEAGGEDALEAGAQSQKRQQHLQSEILKDLARTPESLLVAAGLFEGTESRVQRATVERLLMTFAHHRPDVGYCQGLNFVAALLLCVLGNEHSAFVVFCGLMSKLPEEMFCSDPERLASCRLALQDRVWRALAADRPRLAAHLDSIGLDLNLFLPRWLTTVFSGVLSVPATVRLWDHVLGAGGHGAAVRLALAIVLRAEAKLMQCSEMGDVVEELALAASQVSTAADIDRMLLREMPPWRFERAEERAAAAAAGSGSTVFIQLMCVLASGWALLQGVLGAVSASRFCKLSSRRWHRRRSRHLLRGWIILALLIPLCLRHPPRLPRISHLAEQALLPLDSWFESTDLGRTGATASTASPARSGLQVRWHSVVRRAFPAFLPPEPWPRSKKTSSPPGEVLCDEPPGPKDPDIGGPDTDGHGGSGSGGDGESGGDRPGPGGGSSGPLPDSKAPPAASQSQIQSQSQSQSPAARLNEDAHLRAQQVQKRSEQALRLRSAPPGAKPGLA